MIAATERETDGRPMLAYVPASAAKLLPLFQRFPARVIAEALPSTDQFEPQPFALRFSCQLNAGRC